MCDFPLHKFQEVDHVQYSTTLFLKRDDETLNPSWLIIPILMLRLMQELRLCVHKLAVSWKVYSK